MSSAECRASSEAYRARPLLAPPTATTTGARAESARSWIGRRVSSRAPRPRRTGNARDAHTANLPPTPPRARACSRETRVSQAATNRAEVDAFKERQQKRQKTRDGDGDAKMDDAAEAKAAESKEASDATFCFDMPLQRSARGGGSHDMR